MRIGWRGARMPGRWRRWSRMRSSCRTGRGIRSGCCWGRRASRVPELVPIRHGRMLVSPFTFYRGAALPMAADLAGTPVSGLRVQLCGDAHLSNFGAFASPERQPGLRRQRLRRDASRPVRVGCQAAGRELFGGGAGQRVPDQGPPQDRARGGRGLPHGDARLRAAVVDGGLVRAHGHRADHRRVPVTDQGETVQGRARRCWPRRTPATACRRWASSPPWSTGGGRSSPTRR